MRKALRPLCTAFLIAGAFGGAATVRAQTDTLAVERRYNGVTAGLGVSFINASDIVAFVSTQSGGPRQEDFTAAAEFFGSYEVQTGESWGVKGEYAYLYKSYNVPTAFFNGVFSYALHMPTVVVHTLVTGQGYMLAFGGGAGYHFGRFTADFIGAPATYHAGGIGFKLEAEGNTAFDEHFFGYIGLDVRNDYLGELKDDAGRPILLNGKAMKLNFFSAGIKFGATYFF